MPGSDRPPQPSDPAPASIALASYNGAAFIAEQIRSLLNQDWRPAEIVVSDDHSSDTTLEILQASLVDADSNTRVHVLENATNLGPTRNFERAIAATGGAIVFLCDQDDVWYPQKLRTCLTQFNERPELLLVCSDANLVGAAGESLGPTLFEALELSDDELARLGTGQAFEGLLVRNAVCGATVAIRRELFEMARPFPSEWIHDEWLGVIASAVGEIVVLREALIAYRQHGGNQIGMQALTLSEQAQRIGVVARASLAPEVTRTEILLSHLVSLGPRVPAQRVDYLRERLHHLRFRAGLPDSRGARLLPIAREFAGGRYHRYGRGVRSALRDLFQRTGDPAVTKGASRSR